VAQVINFKQYVESRDVETSSEWQEAYEVVDDFAVSLYNRIRSLIVIVDEYQFDRDFTIALEAVQAALDRQLDDDHQFHPLLDDQSIDVYNEDEDEGDS
jgi:hypothetical protein